MKTGVIVLIVVGLAVVLGGCEFVGTRNKMATEKEAISGQWSQVDADLQRRADLIPNLVQTVKGYAKEETSVVQAVADARAQMAGARSPQEKINASNQMDGALGRLLVVVENYPNLKANENFKQLQFELAGTENRILQSRRRYNEAVQKYNTDLSLFPGNIVASVSGFQREDAYFKTEPGARTVPKVQF
ncbi:MAG TPA: LemA family protein [Bryobacteraceae bacterium]|jgi:LemA protein|nr:LemA family protein [Bryobacteraceae bacterium]